MAAMTDVSVRTDLLASERARGPTRFSGQSIVVGVAGALLIAGACALVLTQSWRQGALFLLGLALGLLCIMPCSDSPRLGAWPLPTGGARACARRC